MCRVTKLENVPPQKTMDAVDVERRSRPPSGAAAALRPGSGGGLLGRVLSTPLKMVAQVRGEERRWERTERETSILPIRFFFLFCFDLTLTLISFFFLSLSLFSNTFTAHRKLRLSSRRRRRTRRRRRRRWDGRDGSSRSSRRTC